jgi:hypothetical protein
MSFSLQISQILQYAYNIFASALPVIYLFIGGAFAVFVLVKLLNLAR